MRLASTILIGIASLGILACSTGTEPGVPLTPTFRYAQAGAPGAPEGGSTPPTVTVTDGRVTVLGLITTGSPCHTLSSAAVAADGLLEITVTATGAATPCIAVIANLAYEASTELPAGTQRIRVLHVNSADGQRVVYDEPLL